MFSKKIKSRKFCFALVFAVGLTGLAQPLFAQFIGISLDGAIAYSAAKKETSGGSIGITLPVPFVPNIGASTISFNETESFDASSGSTKLSLDTKIKIDTVNFFYNIPFPVVSMALGIGAGTMKTTATVTETSGSASNSDKSELTTPVSEAFLHIGLPFWNAVEFHIGYHAISTTQIDVTQKSGIAVTSYGVEKKSYTGGMTTVGIQIAF